MRVVTLLLVVLLVALQGKLWFGEGGLPSVWQLERQIRHQKEENHALKERNLALDAEVLDLKHGLDAIEERARSEMGMIKQGEIFYQVIDTPPPDPDRTVTKK